ncbi:MAG: beta-ketoacyl synthase N-terminal-like domain-containing protein [bacterium]
MPHLAPLTPSLSPQGKGRYRKAVAVACDLVTPYGWGVHACWQGLLSGQSAIRPLDRFSTRHFLTDKAATIPDLKAGPGESFVMNMLIPLLSKASDLGLIPDDSLLILATTTGEIDFLEQSVLRGTQGTAKESRLDCLLAKVVHWSGVVTRSKSRNMPLIVSAACVSSSAAIAQAASLIRNGEQDCLLVVACDSVSEFVMAGFSTLMALDKDMARPFDRDRKGLSLGEAAGFILLMSEERAMREERPIIGEIAGWGMTGDANHMTGPCRDGCGLALAVEKALQSASIPESAVGSISAHGTGTVYNDAMEMKAFKKAFQNRAIPTYSIKGGTGHTMGAAGLLEVIVAFQALKEKMIPPTVNMRCVDEEAKGWVFSQPHSLDGTVTVSTNSGFGGLNAALVLKEYRTEE